MMTKTKIADLMNALLQLTGDEAWLTVDRHELNLYADSDLETVEDIAQDLLERGIEPGDCYGEP